MGKWVSYRLKELLKQYRLTHIVNDNTVYRQITISKWTGVSYRESKIGKEIGRKRQFFIDLKKFPNTILFTRQGIIDGSIGLAPAEVDGCIATENMPMFSVNSEKVYPGLLTNFLKSDIFRNKVKLITPTGSAQKAIHERDLLELDCLIPEKIEEQKHLTDRINTYLLYCKKQLINLENDFRDTNLLRQSILQEAIEGKLTEEWRKQNPIRKCDPNTDAAVLIEKIKEEKQKLIAEGKIKKEKPLAPISKDEVPFDLPEGWVWCRLVDITVLITDGKHGDSSNQSNSGFFFLSAKDLKDGELVYEGAREISYQDFYDTHKRTNLEPGDICIVNTGATIGKIAIAKENDRTRRTTFQKSVAVIKVVRPFIDIKYLVNFLKHQTSNLLEVSRGSAINNLLLGDMKILLIPLPSLSEQQAIVSRVDRLLAMVDELARQVKERKVLAEKMMQAVMREAFEPKD